MLAMPSGCHPCVLRRCNGVPFAHAAAWVGAVHWSCHSCAREAIPCAAWVGGLASEARRIVLKVCTLEHYLQLKALTNSKSVGHRNCIIIYNRAKAKTSAAGVRCRLQGSRFLFGRRFCTSRHHGRRSRHQRPTSRPEPAPFPSPRPPRPCALRRDHGCMRIRLQQDTRQQRAASL